MTNKLSNIIDNMNKKGNTTREWFSPIKEGRYIIRLLQSVEDSEAAPFEEFYLHGGYVHPVYGKSGNYLCTRQRDCPMCYDANNAKRQDPSSWLYKARQFYLYNIIDRTDGHMKLFKLTWAAHNIIKQKIIEAARDGINLMHFKEGRDIELTVRIVNKKIVYSAFILSEKESKPVSGKIEQELRLLKPLIDQYKPYSKQELQDIVDGKRTDYSKLNFEKKKTQSKSSLAESLIKKHNPDSLNKLKSEINDDDVSKRLNDLNLFEDEEENKK